MLDGLAGVEPGDAGVDDDGETVEIVEAVESVESAESVDGALGGGRATRRDWGRAEDWAEDWGWAPEGLNN